MVSVFLIAVSLSLDAFAVSVSCAMAGRGGVKTAVRLGAYFGAFQFIMPLVGYILGHYVAGFLAEISPWVAFGVLSLIGGRMLWGSFHGEEQGGFSELSVTRLLALAVATSIDALAVGVSFAFLRVDILLSSVIIGAVAFGLSFLGGALGEKLGGFLHGHAEGFGGGVLIAIGVKILLENLLRH